MQMVLEIKGPWMGSILKEAVTSKAGLQEAWLRKYIIFEFEVPFHPQSTAWANGSSQPDPHVCDQYGKWHLDVCTAMRADTHFSDLITAFFANLIKSRFSSKNYLDITILGRIHISLSSSGSHILALYNPSAQAALHGIPMKPEPLGTKASILKKKKNSHNSCCTIYQSDSPSLSNFQIFIHSSLRIGFQNQFPSLSLLPKLLLHYLEISLTCEKQSRHLSVAKSPRDSKISFSIWHRFRIKSACGLSQESHAMKERILPLKLQFSSQDNTPKRYWGENQLGSQSDDLWLNMMEKNKVSHTPPPQA